MNREMFLKIDRPTPIQKLLRWEAYLAEQSESPEIIEVLKNIRENFNDISKANRQEYYTALYVFGGRAFDQVGDHVSWAVLKLVEVQSEQRIYC